MLNAAWARRAGMISYLPPLSAGTRQCADLNRDDHTNEMINLVYCTFPSSSPESLAPQGPLRTTVAPPSSQVSHGLHLQHYGDFLLKLQPYGECLMKL